MMALDHQTTLLSKRYIYIISNFRWSQLSGFDMIQKKKHKKIKFQKRMLTWPTWGRPSESIEEFLLILLLLKNFRDLSDLLFWSDRSIVSVWKKPLLGEQGYKLKNKKTTTISTDIDLVSRKRKKKQMNKKELLIKFLKLLCKNDFQQLI